jgi:hypothetical protein
MTDAAESPKIRPNVVPLSKEVAMCFFFSPATICLTIGYFVLFAASKADVFGWVLAIWLFVIAAFIPIAGAYVTLAGLCPMEYILRTLHSARP